MEMVVGGLKRALAGFSPVHKRSREYWGGRDHECVCIYVGGGELDQAGGGGRGEEVLVFVGLPVDVDCGFKREELHGEKKKRPFSLPTSGACCPARHYSGKTPV